VYQGTHWGAKRERILAFHYPLRVHPFMSSWVQVDLILGCILFCMLLLSWHYYSKVSIDGIMTLEVDMQKNCQNMHAFSFILGGTSS
jgi:hypothetical protein